MTNGLSRRDHLGLEKQAQAKPEIIAKKGHSLLSQLRIRRAVAKAFSDPAWHAPGLARFAASIGGGLPEADPGGLILAACNDFYYSRFTATLLLSLEAQRACQAVHLHLYEPSEATLAHIAMLKGAFRFVRLTWTTDRCDLAASLHYRTIYYAAGRFLVSALILNTQQRPILCIDGDGIAIRPVWPAYEPYLASGDVGLIFRKAKRNIQFRRGSRVGGAPAARTPVPPRSDRALLQCRARGQANREHWFLRHAAWLCGPRIQRGCSDLDGERMADQGL